MTEKSAAQVYEWHDSVPTGAIGWVVFYNMCNKVCGGGIFMHANATEKETEDIAYNMAKKFTVCEPMIGGAKAGIRFPHTDPRASQVLRRFIIDNKQLLNNSWVTAGDLNTDDTFIESVINNDLGIPTCQWMLAKRIEIETGKNRSGQLSKAIKHPAFVNGPPLIESTVGYGLAATFEPVKQYYSKTKNMELRLVIQGFGAVGSNLAYWIHNKNIGKVVAIADYKGYIYDTNGIDINKLFDIRHKKVNELKIQGANDNDIQNINKNLYPLIDISGYQFYSRDTPFNSKGDIEFMCKFLQTVHVCKFNAFSACAIRYQITKEVATELIKCDVKIISCGANNVYGEFNSNGQLVLNNGSVRKLLESNDISIVPDWVANSGTAQLFHRSLSVDFDLNKINVADIILEACAIPIRDYLKQVMEKTAGDNSKISDTCEELAEYYISNPRPLIQPKENYINPGKSIYALEPLPKYRQLTIEERVKLCQQVGCELIKEEELVTLLKTCSNPVAYDGFEPSGQMHIAQGLLKSINVNRLTKSGFTFIFWVADWFAFLNKKMDGDMEKIKNLGKYFIEVWKACGMDMERVVFLWASEEFSKRGDEYWARVMDISTSFTAHRISECTAIMGRNKADELQVSQYLYPCMQCADIFFLGVDVCQLGLDQRKVNMLAREYAGKKKLNSPIIMSHGMMPGLLEGQEKMSKSNPDSAIFMEDSIADVNRKIKKAYCPEGIIENNPCMAYFKDLVFPILEGQAVNIVRPEKYGGTVSFTNYTTFETAFINKEIHPKDVKETLSNFLNDRIQPVRDHFENNADAKALLNLIRSYKVTR